MGKDLPIETFERWLLTKEGAKVLKSITDHCPTIKHEYLKNCLWWAYYSGQQSEDIRPTEAGDILRHIKGMAVYKHFGYYFKQRFEQVLEQSNITK